jgi:DNA-directed RNA polymerase specialized sigma24 family protein
LFSIDLKDALDRFNVFAPTEALAFRLFYFLGCTFDETAEILQVSATEVKRLCKKTKCGGSAI